LEAIAAASWLPNGEAMPIVETAGAQPIDNWIQPVHETALAYLRGGSVDAVPVAKVPPPTKPLSVEAMALYTKGAEVYRREGHCITCHQENGLGLPAAMFPPLAGTEWAQGSEERLIKLTLHGLLGPIEVKGQKYPGQVPMTQFKGLSDEEIAAVLTYVRNSFGNGASPITPDKVKAVRAATAKQEGFYAPADLLGEHP
jgi:mono/diheme cytochrome c family protein